MEPPGIPVDAGDVQKGHLIGVFFLHPPGNLPPQGAKRLVQAPLKLLPVGFKPGLFVV
jgi:hypothetical protein